MRRPTGLSGSAGARRPTGAKALSCGFIILGGVEQVRRFAKSVDDLRGAQAAGAQIVDLRMPAAYIRAHIPESINVPYTGQGFIEQAAFYLEREAAVLLVADSPQIADLALRDLEGAGFSVEGMLEGGIPAWKQAGERTASVGQITAGELEDLIAKGEAPLLVDVREAWEFQAGHIRDAKLMPLSQFPQTYGELPQDAPIVFVCASGARSGEVVQFLYRLGYRQVYNLLGGMAGWLAGRRRA